MNQPVTPIPTAFRWFADKVFGGRSALYAHLARAIADDPTLWDLVALIPPGQPAPNMLFGAVHDRLLAGVTHPLAVFYPSVGGDQLVSNETYPAFVAFCEQEAEAIRPILATRTLQTNEVGRSALWLPAMCQVAAAADEPLFLVECGPSAGLNLYWDRYGYRYGDGPVLGDPSSPVQLRCELKGEAQPAFRNPFPAVAGRVGVDLHPIDVRDGDQVRWVRALLWPEQSERAALLAAAVSVVQADPPVMLAGDGVVRLPEAVALAPAGTTVVVMHSFMANQLTEDQRQTFDAGFLAMGRQRPIHRLAIEWPGGDFPTMSWTQYDRGETSHVTLATADQHGQWLAWQP
jgi:hypothetical protein